MPAFVQVLAVDQGQEFWIGEPGISAWVKVRDNDVTSFDVWINGNRRREVKKKRELPAAGRMKR